MAAKQLPPEFKPQYLLRRIIITVMDRETGGGILERVLLDASADPIDLPLSLLKSITNDFSDDRNIGSGGFASVYKGILSNGTVAVKRLHPAVDMDEKSFRREVTSLVRVKHNNVVRFLGYCGETQVKVENYMGRVVVADMRQRLLCFEFMPNGGLDKYVDDASRGLDWRTRYRIIKGICKGLYYLHQQNIVHSDLKPANILLDQHMVPKIADFGLAKCFEETQTRLMTLNISRSLGYMAPECYGGEITLKSDIYSLGVIINEILTGKKYLDIENVLENWRYRFETSKESTWLEHVKLCAEIGITCTKYNPMDRPGANDILKMLDEIDCRYGFIETAVCTSSATYDVTPISPNPKELETEEKPQKSLNENKVLRQQAVAISLTAKSLAAYPKSPFQLKTPENGNALNGEVKSSPDVTPISPNPKELEAEEKPQKSLNEKQQENQDLLIKCVSQDLGFSSGKPIAACLIYRCLLHWRSFEVERTGVFDRIIQTIGSAIEDNDDKLAYWLSNSSTLLLLLQRTLETTGAAGLTPQRRRSSAAFFGKVFSGMRASPQSAGGDLRQVEAKYPALLFKQQLTAFLEKIYGMIRDNLKKEISPLLGLCIQAPRTSRASLIKGSRSQANALAQQTLIVHWQSIVKILTNYLNVLKANYVPSFLISKVFTQIFSFINVQLFNSILLRRDCCSLSNGEYVKSGLAELEQWCIYATEEYAGSSWEELKHIRQAVGFLVIHEKGNKTLKDITSDLCPVLSIQQLYRISTMYWDDKYGTHTVSSDVLSSMRVMMTEDSNNAVSSSFLLDDDSSIPFSVDDISKSMTEIEVTDVDMPPLVRENSGFTFLHQRKD